eukprot:CCRYP_008335-RA/>CCRYP_008335-RA protein AED:0.00 eAED:0.00 QI:100/-1/1/1/-1/1/1/220/330
MLAPLQIIVLASQAILITSKPHQLTVGFVPTLQRRITSRQKSLLSNFSYLTATVFYPDEDEGPRFNDAILSSHNPDLQAEQEQLAMKLSHHSNSQTLAHLAAAFSPPGHSIPLTHIHQVRCASLDSTHLEIETVICDDIECASLLVPVPFPVECSWTNDAAFEECIMRNVQSLNQEGERRIFGKDEFSEEQQNTLAHDKLKSAIERLSRDDKPPAIFPEWWIPPRMDETWECDLLRDALNGDDMESVRMDLVKTQEPDLLPQMDESKAHHVVKVLAIGPMGMMLEVTAIDSDERTHKVLACDTVVIKFSLEDKSSIRDEVLRLVSSINVN